MGSSIRFDDIETVMWTILPTQILIYGSFSSSVGTRIDSKLQNARSLMVILRNWKIESFLLFKQGFAELIHVLWVNMSHSILVSLEILIQVI